MAPERKAAAVSMLKVLRSDIEADVAALEGQPFTGLVVAEALCKFAAQIDALAHVLIEELSPELIEWPGILKGGSKS